MTDQTHPSPDERHVRQILEDWARSTRTGAQDLVLQDFMPEALIYDVLAPMKYEGTDAYRRSWDDWQPETQGEGKFALQDLAVTAGADVAFASCFIQCGGTLPDGRSFEDLVRATFCLRKVDGHWKVAHSHVSKPVGGAG
jgi:ketosteroid isomerase-like protein